MDINSTGIETTSQGLFYNSPMEACIMICKTNKEPERKKDDKELERFMGILKSCFDEE